MSVMRPRPVYVAGDSQSLIYGDRVWFEARHDCYVARSVYCSGLYAGGLADEAGRLNEVVVTAFRGVRLLTLVGDELHASHHSPDPNVFSVAQADGRSIVEPPLAFTVGQLDLQHLARYLPQDDVELPPEVAEHFEVLPEGRTTDDDACSALELMTIVGAQFNGFRYGARRLRQLGFQQVGVLSIPPPGADDEVFRAIRAMLGLPDNARRYHKRFRYKLVLALNYELKRLCNEEGLDFIDRWPEQTARGVVRPGVLTDGIHLSGEAADRTMRRLALWVESTAGGER